MTLMKTGTNQAQCSFNSNFRTSTNPCRDKVTCTMTYPGRPADSEPVRQCEYHAETWSAPWTKQPL